MRKYMCPVALRPLDVPATKPCLNAAENRTRRITVRQLNREIRLEHTSRVQYLSQVAVARALSSQISWNILRLLTGSELEEPEISRSLGIRASLMKIPLDKLVEAGIVDVKEEVAPSRDRVRRIYRLTGTEKSAGFPPRNYMYLSESLINTLRVSLGEESARMLLRDMGIRMGEDIGKSLISRTSSTKWDPDIFAKHFVKGLLEEMGFHAKIVRVGKHQIIYEERNCLFEDLAMKYSGLMCDILDVAVHEGIDEALGDMKTTRLACKGHGDPACRYRVDWPKNARKSQAKK